MPQEEHLTFSEATKRSLAQTPPKKRCCKHALACGIYLTSRSFAQSGQITDPEWLCRLLSRLHMTDLSLVGELFTQEKALSDIFRCEACTGSFLMGAFLCCATITDPKRGYHLEFSFAFPQVLPLIEETLTSVGVYPKKAIRRNGQAALYFKDSESITDFLNLIGAQKEAFSVMNEKIRKDLLNSANRQKNCDTANIDKLVEAAQAQIDAIQLLQAKGILSQLPEHLQYTARLRCENPELSLPELAAIHEDRVSKSGVNHRLQKLIGLAKDAE